MDSKDYAILVLVGQVPFITQLNRQPHEALRQRIVINYNLQGLTKDEVKDYIVFSLKNVGCSEPIFTDGAFKLLFSSTNGFLRKINRLTKCVL
jgi:type II secretory pathway predicted ATPase ExeA